jgi:hypothetical protein
MRLSAFATGRQLGAHNNTAAMLDPQGSALARATSDSRPPGDPPTQSLAAAASG